MHSSQPPLTQQQQQQWQHCEPVLNGWHLPQWQQHTQQQQWLAGGRLQHRSAQRQQYQLGVAASFAAVQLRVRVQLAAAAAAAAGGGTGGHRGL